MVLTCPVWPVSGLVDMCRRFRLNVKNFDMDWGEGVPLDLYRRRLEADKHRIKLFARHNETATGVTSDIAGIRMILDLNHPALLLLMASARSAPSISGWKNGAFAVAGSQKGFMLPACIVGVSDKALAARERGDHPSCYLILATWPKPTIRVFPYTPAVTLLRGLRMVICSWMKGWTM